MRILIADEDPALTESLRLGFQLQWPDCIVPALADGARALDAFHEQPPDAVVWSTGLSSPDPCTVLGEIRRFSRVPFLLLAPRRDEADELRALELGADQYLAKPISVLLLAAHLRALLRRAEARFPSRALPEFRAGPLRIQFELRRVSLHGQPVHLTPFEYKLLYHLVRSAGRTMSVQTLSRRVWGLGDESVSERVRFIVSHLRSKIEPDPSQPRWVEHVPGGGYRFAAPRPVHDPRRGSAG